MAKIFYSIAIFAFLSSIIFSNTFGSTNGQLILNTSVAKEYKEKEEELYTKQYFNCIDKSGGVTVEMLDCISAEMEIQDDRLNDIYQKLLYGLSSERKQELIKVQNLWIKYRDANCKFYLDPQGGTLATLTSSSCFLNMTALRSQELSRLSNE